jgi:hypothetical protein
MSRMRRLFSFLKTSFIYGGNNDQKFIYWFISNLLHWELYFVLISVFIGMVIAFKPLFGYQEIIWAYTVGLFTSLLTEDFKNGVNKIMGNE